MKRLATLFVLLLALVITGCASVPMASLEDDTKAKNFVPPENKASIYIFRNENIGGAIPMSVAVNSRTLGQTAAMTYFRIDVPSGKYNIESHAENVSNVSLQTEAGKNYYVWQEVKMGMWMARSLLQQVDETTGKAAVKQCKLITTNLQMSELQPANSQGAGDSASHKLKELETMRKDGLISDDEYQKKRVQILERM